ncbi:hypothetical protein EDC01DRAFT_297879 [Geopyxis carbonaria]|nr:hypothetical protein EDC01DRAFT_297879 [Geopyxis carbonaria]
MCTYRIWTACTRSCAWELGKSERIRASWGRASPIRAGRKCGMQKWTRLQCSRKRAEGRQGRQHSRFARRPCSAGDSWCGIYCVSIPVGAMGRGLFPDRIRPRRGRRRASALLCSVHSLTQRWALLQARCKPSGAVGGRACVCGRLAVRDFSGTLKISGGTGREGS